MANQYRNTGFLGIIQDYNDTMSWIKAGEVGGVSAMLEQRNRIALREAQLDAAQQLSEMNERLARQERQLAAAEWERGAPERARVAAEQARVAAEQERAAAERERERKRERERERERAARVREQNRIAALPKCSECKSPIEGLPNECPQCKELLLWFRKMAFALPQVQEHLSSPSDWPVFGNEECGGSDLLSLQADIEGSLTRIVSQDASLKAQVFQSQAEFEAHLQSSASTIDEVQSKIEDLRSSIATRTKQIEESTIAPPDLLSDYMVPFGPAAVVAVIGLTATIGGERGSPVGYAIFFGILGIALVAGAFWHRKIRTVKNEQIRQQEIDAMVDKVNQSIESGEKRLESMEAGVPGECERLLSYLSQVNGLRDESSEMRDMWLRMCEASHRAIPAHMLSTTDGPLPLNEIEMLTSPASINERIASLENGKRLPPLTVPLSQRLLSRVRTLRTL